MENIKAILTIGAILVLPLILAPQFFVGLFIVIAACLAFRQRNF